MDAGRLFGALAEMTWQILCRSPRAQLTLLLDGPGPDIMSDVDMMRTARVTAYVGGAVPPLDKRRSFVALPAPDYVRQK
jgi:hypothetical protein